MKMIDALNKMHRNEIDNNTFLYVYEENGNVTKKFVYNGDYFVDIEEPGYDGLLLHYGIDTTFLNLDVELMEE